MQLFPALYSPCLLQYMAKHICKCWWKGRNISNHWFSCFYCALSLNYTPGCIARKCHQMRCHITCTYALSFTLASSTVTVQGTEGCFFLSMFALVLSKY